MLNPKLAKKFEIVGEPQSQRYHTQFGIIDFSTINEEMAGKLVDSGFKWLKRVEKKVPTEVGKKKS